MDLAGGNTAGWSVCAVPPRKQAARARGWEHLERICSALKWDFGLRAATALVRLEGRAQKSLDREGRIARRDAFSLKPRARIASRILLIDDVMTTGATLSACAATLKSGGAREVRCAALCQVA
jgi:predicted amidophosphoribosyltransferase